MATLTLNALTPVLCSRPILPLAMSRSNLKPSPVNNMSLYLLGIQTAISERRFSSSMKVYFCLNVDHSK